MGALTAQAMDAALAASLSAAPHMDKKGAGKARTAIKYLRNPKYLSLRAAPREALHLYQVLRYPLMTEAAVTLMEKDNTLVFVVDPRADKKLIRGAVEGLLGVGARRVNTLIRPDGSKKAFVKLAPEYVAADVANNMGMF